LELDYPFATMAMVWGRAIRMAEPVHLTSIMAEIGTSRQLPQLTFSISVARDAPRQPLRNLLQYPAIPVWISERHKGAVTEVLGLWAGDAFSYTGKPASGSDCTEKHFARVDALGDELPGRRLDVVDGQEQAFQ